MCVTRFEIHDVEKGYYADKEDAYDMRKEFKVQTKKTPAGGRPLIGSKKPKKHASDMGNELNDLAENEFSEGAKKAAVADDDDGVDVLAEDNPVAGETTNTTHGSSGAGAEQVAPKDHKASNPNGDDCAGAKKKNNKKKKK